MTECETKVFTESLWGSVNTVRLIWPPSQGENIKTQECFCKSPKRWLAGGTCFVHIKSWSTTKDNFTKQAFAKSASYIKNGLNKNKKNLLVVRLGQYICKTCVTSPVIILLAVHTWRQMNGETGKKACMCAWVILCVCVCGVVCMRSCVHLCVCVCVCV